MGNRQQPTSWSHYVSRYLLRLEIIIISKNNLNSVHTRIYLIFIVTFVFATNDNNFIVRLSVTCELF